MRRLTILAMMLAACGGSGTTSDAGGMDGGGSPADAGRDATRADGGCSTDADGDGHVSVACGGDDCNDADPNDYPGNHEVCDMAGHDEDCNPATLGPDLDGDGFVSTMCCDTQPSGMLLCGTDCDDTRATVNPTAAEACNMLDDNCNGMIDEGVSRTCYVDADGDGYAASAVGAITGVCGGCPTLTTATAPGAMTTDCDDHDASAHPGAPEVCDGIDNNCDGMVDEGTTVLCYRDADGDTYRDATVTGMRCACDTGWLPPSAPVDCCDSDAGAYPGVTAYMATADACGSFDWNCNGTAEMAPGGPSSTTIVCGSAASCGCALPGTPFCSSKFAYTAPVGDPRCGTDAACGDSLSTVQCAAGSPTSATGACSAGEHVCAGGTDTRTVSCR